MVRCECQLRCLCLVARVAYLQSCSLHAVYIAHTEKHNLRIVKPVCAELARETRRVNNVLPTATSYTDADRRKSNYHY